MIQYKIYRKDNYIFVVNNSTQETQYGFVKEVFIDKSNINTPNYRLFNVRDFDDKLVLNINQILKEDGSAYTTSEFDDFRNKNTGNFNSGGNSQGVQSVTGDFVDNSDPQNPIINFTGVESVSGDLVDNTDPQNPVINGAGESIPDDFYIATLIDSSKLLYESNGFKELELQPYVSVTITNTNEIVRNGNDLFIVGNYSDTNTLPVFLVKIKNCRLQNDILVFDSITSTTLSYPIHGLVFHNNFLYSSSRTTNSIITKINPNDFSDIRTLTLPETAEFNGFTTDILGYKNKLYILANTATGQSAKFIEISDSLTSYRNVFTIPTVATTYNNARNPPFLIYNDEIYITFNAVGDLAAIRVYDLQGNIKRQRTGIPLTTLVSGGTVAQAHWMGIFNNKILITYTYRKSLLRLDCETLASEETIALQSSITDDNSIFSNGYIYLNGEYNSFDPTLSVNLYKIKYNNFSDKTDLLVNYNNSKGSYGSIGTYPIKESLNTLPVSATVSGIVNNVPLQELGGVDKVINTVRIGKGEGSNNTGNIVLGGDGNLSLNTTGSQNTMLGYGVGAANTTGSFNTGIGNFTLRLNTTGGLNTAVGNTSLRNNTTGNNNTAFGTSSLNKIISGNNNTGLGYFALWNSLGDRNIGVGSLAGSGITTGTGNVVIANSVANTVGGITTGSNNVLLAPNDGNITGLTTGSGNIIIGKVSTLAAAATNTITISDGVGNIMLSKTTAGEVTLPNLTTALITSGGAKSVVTREYIDNNVITNTVSAASTFSVIFTGKVNYHTFNGTTSTYTMPVVAGNVTRRIVIINQGTGDITLNSNGGANDLWESGVVMATMIIPKDTTLSLYNNSINWSVLGA